MRSPPQDLVLFCRNEHPRLVGALTLYTGDRALAEELAQEALVKACERWEQVSKLAAPGAWTHRVAMNAANSWFRRRAAERRALRRLEGDADEAVSDPDAADAIVIRRAVADLPHRQGQALVLRFYVQLSVVETADWMRTTEAAVKSLTQRGLAALRNRFGEMPAGSSDLEADDVTR
jgi:RNA polymerase sigma factor (sigma-70 family)